MEGICLGLRACLFEDRICQKRKNNKAELRKIWKNGNERAQSRPSLGLKVLTSLFLPLTMATL